MNLQKVLVTKEWLEQTFDDLSEDQIMELLERHWADPYDSPLDLWVHKENNHNTSSAILGGSELNLAQTSSNEQDNQGSITAYMTNKKNYYTYAQLNFGEQYQPIKVNVDTGSSWIWTYADECTPQQQIYDLRCKASNSFHTKNSSTIQYTGDTKFIQYGKGTTEGQIVKDTVSIGDAEDDEIIEVYDMPFILQEKGADGRRATRAEGILGMAPRDESAGPLFVERLYE